VIVPSAWVALPPTVTEVPVVTVVPFAGDVIVATGAGSPTPCSATLPNVAPLEVSVTV
jgi:hypothetical protein